MGFDYVDVNFETADGLTLHGWYIYARNPRGTVLFLHGNAGNISHRLDSVAIFHELGFNTFIIRLPWIRPERRKTRRGGDLPGCRRCLAASGH